MLIRLRNRATKEQVRLPDTDALRRQHRWMERSNEAQASFDILLDAGERRGHLLDFKGVKDGKEVTHTIDTRMIHSYRSYSGDLHSGGRMYGHSMQGVPGHLRAGVVLCGQRVAEPDFSALHARLLYAHAGIILPNNYDPYTDIEWGQGLAPKARRDRLKLGFLILVNAHWGYNGAIAAMLMREDGRKGIPERTDIDDAGAMVRAIKKAHAPIAHMLHADMGVRFQKIDSDMAVKVIDKLVLRQGIPCLQIFDSFMVGERHEDHTRGIMDDVLGDTLKDVSATMKVRGKTMGSLEKVPHTRAWDPSLPPTHRWAADSSNPYHDPLFRRPRSKPKAQPMLRPVPSSKPRFMVKPKAAPPADSTVCVVHPVPCATVPAEASTTHDRVGAPTSPTPIKEALPAASLVASPACPLHPATPPVEPAVARSSASLPARARRPSFAQPGYDGTAAELASLAAAPLSGARRRGRTKASRRTSP